MPPSIAAARTILMFVSGSYLLSAGILGVMRARGTTVPGWVIAGWILSGMIGLGLSLLLSRGTPAVWIGLAVALGPWMAYSLVGDLRLGHWVVAVTDLAAIGAIAYALTISTREAFST